MRVRERLRKDPPRSGSAGSGGKSSNAAAKKLTSQTKNRPMPVSGGGKSINDPKDAAARLLTSKMKDVKSVAELLDLLDGVVDDPIFNKIHASAAYHSLATKWKGGLTPNDEARPVFPRLAARVQRITEEGQVGPREVANVLYSLGKLSDDLDVPKGLLMALVESLGEKASGMNEQELSNSLLACVQLKGVAPEVLTPQTFCTDLDEGKGHETTRTFQQFVGIRSIEG